jgi:hypothetical protein
MMTRQIIDYPETQENWDNLPQEFQDYLEVLDNAKVLDNINEGYGEAAYDDYVSSAYSY